MALPAVDHLVFAAPDLDGAIVQLEAALGVRASQGGRHVGLGTHNALIALGGGAYLEIIAPDPTQPPPERPRPFGIDSLTTGRLTTWAMKAPDIERTVADARAAGFEAGAILPLSRDTPEGVHLEWRLTMGANAGDGLVPFLIDWGNTPHPSAGATKGCTLLSLRGEHPAPAGLVAPLGALGVELAVAKGSAPALVATIETPRGTVELR